MPASPKPSTPPSSEVSSNLPPPRTKKPMKPVSAPLSNTRLHNLIYILIITTSVLLAFYSYRLVQHKSEVGGWWNLVLGRPKPSTAHTGTGAGEKLREGKRKQSEEERKGELESKIHDLATELGIPSKDLASAIAVAVRDYVPPASLSSVAAKQTGEAVEAMVNGGDEEAEAYATNGQGKQGQASGGVVEGVVEGLNGFVGFDEP